MNLEIYDHFDFTDEEQKLIEQLRKALIPLQNIVLVESRTFGRMIPSLGALIYPNAWPRAETGPLRLDIKAYIPGEIGQAFIAPAGGFLLTEELFDGEQFTEKFHQKLKRCIADYCEYMEE